MLQTLAVAGYRSLFDLTLPMGQLNLVTGDNGSGKSNLYRALRLLAATARDGVGSALAEEGGLESALWAGPERISRRMMTGEVPLQGTLRSMPVSLRLGFATDAFGYAIDVGLPVPSQSLFDHDPQIKCESVWAGPFRRDSTVLLERRAGAVRVRAGRGWDVLEDKLASFDSVFSQLVDPQRMPELFMLREYIRQWRFHHQFRSDAGAPARQPCMGIRTPVLSDDGHDLAAAWQTIIEIGDDTGLKASLCDAFPGAHVQIDANEGRLSLRFHQPGLLRPLAAAELSDGTLRYLLLLAALHTPRPPPLLVLNEPETSLHPDLLPALARLIIGASARSQLWVVSHASRLIAALKEHPGCNVLPLYKEFSQTRVEGMGNLEGPPWSWPQR